MKGYVDQLERLGYILPQDLVVGLILNGLTKDFVRLCYNMHNMRKTIGELHAMLIEYENGLSKKAETPQVMMIKGGKIQKAKKKSLKAKGKGSGSLEEELSCYLAELLKKKKQVGSASSSVGGQDEDTSPSEITSEIPIEVKGFEPPQKEDRLCLNVEVEEYRLRDLNEPASYKAAILASESNKWIDAVNAEIQSMMDNMVWVLVDLPPSCKTVGSKWIFKKKTDMDGIVHTYKARLVAKGYTQLYGVDYEETFSPVADIRAIRILISIAAYYDYEI
nr:putative retrotransposon Ty1-copia subclass protein [Tanacetum cinerariifolium]